MSFNITHSSDRKTIAWAGGTTTELFIFPAEATFAGRNFSFRLSQATVEIEASNFSDFSGITRTLMVVKGEIKLTHENHHVAQLRPLDVDVFDGGWTTRAVGKCTDFNLMTRGKTQGSVVGQSLNQGQTIQIKRANKERLFLYLYSGEVTLLTDADESKMSDADFTEISADSFSINSLSASTLIVVSVAVG